MGVPRQAWPGHAYFMASSLPGNSLSLSSVGRDEPRRASCKPFSFIFESMITIPQLSRLHPPEAILWIRFIATSKAKLAKITFIRLSTFYTHVRGHVKKGDPPVHVFNGLKQNINPTASPASPFLSSEFFIRHPSPNSDEDSAFLWSGTRMCVFLCEEAEGLKVISNTRFSALTVSVMLHICSRTLSSNFSEQQVTIIITYAQQCPLPRQRLISVYHHVTCFSFHL